MKLYRQNNGRFKKHYYRISKKYNKTILKWTSGAYLLIFAFSGTYIQELKSLTSQIYEPYKITINNPLPDFQKPFSAPQPREETNQERNEGNRKETIEEPVATITRVAEEEGFGDIEMLIKIANCESSMNPLAINQNIDGSFDVGLFQINEYWHGYDRECYLDSECATRKAIEIQRKAGSFLPWVCFWKYNL